MGLIDPGEGAHLLRDDPRRVREDDESTALAQLAAHTAAERRRASAAAAVLAVFGVSLEEPLGQDAPVYAVAGVPKIDLSGIGYTRTVEQRKHEYQPMDLEDEYMPLDVAWYDNDHGFRAEDWSLDALLGDAETRAKAVMTATRAAQSGKHVT
ncbi:MAG: hypothetical protein MHM6MM_009218, partial [Cercozoa sp. M6MM]